MRVLVTGGAGYVGSHAALQLARSGHEPVVFDDLSTGHRRLAQGFELIVGNIGNRAEVAPALRDIDAVMHFAASTEVGESVRNPRKYFENNVAASLSLLEAVLQAGVRLFVFSSSAAVYGPPKSVPIREQSPCAPQSPYGFSKFTIERALESYGAAYGLHSVSLRYFNAAGADEEGRIGECHDPETHLIPRALDAAQSGTELEIFGDDYETPDGTCVRDYVHVTDLARAHVSALSYLEAGGATTALNLGTGQGSSVLEVIRQVEKTTGSEVRRRVVARRDGDPPELVADPSAAATVLAWHAERSLPAMISSAWHWMTLGRKTAMASRS
jgi:UDP-glucose-4-epimerase GalE